MSAIAPDKQEVVKELYSRRDSLTPDKRAIVDELATRMGFTGNPNASIPVERQTQPARQEDLSARPSGLKTAFQAVHGLLTGNPYEIAAAATAPPSVASDQAAHVLSGIPTALTGIPAFLKTAIPAALTGNAKQIVDMAKGAVAPAWTLTKQAIELAKPGLVNAPSPDAPETAQAAEGAGGVLGGAIMAGIEPHLVAGAKALIKTVLPSAETLDTAAAANKARALNPTTLQGKADAAAIAPELAQTGKAGGLRGKTIDANVMADLNETGQRVKAVETRLAEDPRPELQTSKQSLLDEIDSAQNKLKIPRTGVTARPEAITQLQDIRSIVSKLPEFIDFDQLIDLRRQLDQRAEEAGAFGVNADTLKASLNRGVADMVRGKLNSLDPELKIANHDYSVSRKAADIVERRQLTETGKISSGLPSRGGILDDILATWAGHAMGGAPGGAVAEAINLGRQTRGFANLKSGFQQQLANFVREPQRAPAGLLGPGSPQLSAPETSEVTGSPAIPAPATREIRTGRLLGPGIQLPPPTELPSGGFEMSVRSGDLPIRGYADYFRVGNKEVPRIASEGPAKGMTLSHIEPGITGVKNPVYVYTENATGRQLRFTQPQK